ncbi:uncharacterized protein EV420DRAFT_1153980 [Desarmillaria tabescens]|uniref:CsbD-like domain-containing protein n=1 Tax=Armillaria tabescens TaxID=1929756 RepID=A0AA39T420_ARMTA|nr:uncharacterized protein EV420DRAFT_1153980 [Desarmillaria tabescens]KAK0463076.1 hypothetical protein EV420DRAFT_1153980 [Desarmillaria tabescens]
MSQNTDDNYNQSTQPQHHLHGSNDPLPGDRSGNMDEQNMGGDNLGQGGQRQPESAFGEYQQSGGGRQQQGGNVRLGSGAGAGDWERGAGQAQGGVPVEGHHHHHHHGHHAGQQSEQAAQQAAQQPVSTTDKLLGKTEKIIGKASDNTEMQMKGEQRQTGGKAAQGLGGQSGM